MAQVDARSFFYQFKLDKSAQRLFGCTMVATRGAQRHLRFAVLPMGFKYAPGIAQHTSMHILKNMKWSGVKRAWVDNFLFGGESVEHVHEGLREFLGLCRFVGLDVKPAEVGTSLTVLGARMDLSNKTVSPTEEAVQALKEAWAALPHPTPRKIFRFMGTALWQLVAIHRVPLCVIEPAIEVMRTVLPDKHGWDAPCQLSTEENQALKAVLGLTEKGRFSRAQRSDKVSLWWSDASEAHLGWVWGQDAVAIARTPIRGIFARELLAGATALLNAERAHEVARLCIDNKAAERALIRGLSSSRAGNIILRRLYEANLVKQHEVTWVSTTIQRADNPSRGILTLPPAPILDDAGTKLRWAGKGGGDSIHSWQPEKT
jgi:hypothetical protein